MQNHSILSAAFTLVELLVVITIIAIAAGLLAPVLGQVRNSVDRISAAANFRQWELATLTFVGDHAGALPVGQVGAGMITWSEAADPTNNRAWFNALPRIHGKMAAGDYVTTPDDFYRAGGLFHTRAAKYPLTKTTQPYFSFSINSKLMDTNETIVISQINRPSRTAIFLESGLPDEPKLYPTQSSYNGQPHTFASRFVARYGGGKLGLVLFADGHVEAPLDRDVVEAVTGKAYYPQDLGKVIWTLNPEDDPNN